MDRATLIHYVKNHWTEDVAMTAPQAGKIFDISRGNARYYLNQLVDEGILIKLQHEYNVWYLLAMHRKSFEKYLSIGVVVK